jgi:hypothetical protein
MHAAGYMAEKAEDESTALYNDYMQSVSTTVCLCGIFSIEGTMVRCHVIEISKSFPICHS